MSSGRIDLDAHGGAVLLLVMYRDGHATVTHEPDLTDLDAAAMLRDIPHRLDGLNPARAYPNHVRERFDPPTF